MCVTCREEHRVGVKIGWEGHAAHTGAIRNTYKALVVKSEEKR
jgi:hypothetical protein